MKILTIFAHMEQEHDCNSALIKHMDNSTIAATDLKKTFSWLPGEGIQFSMCIGHVKARGGKSEANTCKRT